MHDQHCMHDVDMQGYVMYMCMYAAIREMNVSHSRRTSSCRPALSVVSFSNFAM